MSGVNKNQEHSSSETISQTKNKTEQQQNSDNRGRESVCTEEDALDYMVAIPETDGQVNF